MSGAMTEFKITTDLAALRQQVIEANFEEVRAWLDENLAPFRDMAVSADDVPTAKTYRANIRKVKDRIEQSRKEAKAAALAAYSDFESKCKELTTLCDEAAYNIDAQVKAFEDAEKTEKLEKLHSEYIAMTNDEMELYCPWECVFKDKWANKTFAYDAAVGEIKSALEQTINDLAAIRDMGGNDTPYLLDVYKQTHELSAVVRKASELKTMRANEEARKRREAEIPSNMPSNDSANQPKEYLPKTVNAPATPNETVTVCFKVICTKPQLAALGAYMKQNGIIYGKIGE